MDERIPGVVPEVVRPASELAGSGWRGRSFLVILAELIEEDPTSLEPVIADALHRTGGHEVYALLGDRLGHLDPDLRNERYALATGFILRATADRARELDRGRRRRPRLDDERFVTNLVEMVTAALGAPATP